MPEVVDFGIEVASAVLCFVLVRFMFKPYSLTKEGRYLGLPVGFAFLGISEAMLAIGILQPAGELRLISLLTRTFAYVFMAATYYFSKEPAKKSRLLWSITFGLIIVSLTTLAVLMVRGLEFGFNINPSLSIFLRLLALFCISYMCVRTLRSHLQALEPSTLWIPIGFIFLGISQYSLIIWAADANFSQGYAFVGGLIARFVGLGIFVAVAYSSFYKTKKWRLNEKPSA
jgi:O-antigen ligase